MEPVEYLGLAVGWGGATSDMEVTLTPVLRNRGEGGVGYFNYGNYKNDKLDALVAASIKEPDPAKREQLIRAACANMPSRCTPFPCTAR